MRLIDEALETEFGADEEYTGWEQSQINTTQLNLNINNDAAEER